VNGLAQDPELNAKTPGRKAAKEAEAEP